MKRYATTYVELRDQGVRIDYIMAPAEPDVGIFGDYVDEVVVLDMEGRPLPWELTDAEEQHVTDKCFEADGAMAAIEPDDPYDPTDWAEPPK